MAGGRKKSELKEARLKRFAAEVNRQMLRRGWTQTDVTQAMQRVAPPGVPIGRHLINSWVNARSEPTAQYLNLLAQAFGVKPNVLLNDIDNPADAAASPVASMTTGLDGRSRLILDVDIDSETALKILALVRQAEGKKGAA